ncbi:MAG: DNA polymerase Y family protein [Actinomycetota bacterium]
MSGPAPIRTLVAWCPDWPVVATGADLGDPVAVVYANRIVAASPGARAHGVQRGLRRRAAQGRCAALDLHERDEAREARLYEPVVAALDDITPRVEVTRPGTCALVMRGPSRYFGGDAAVAELVQNRLAGVIAGRTDVRVGVADGPFAAELAARAASVNGEPRIVPAGDVAGFLAPMNIDVLERPELVDVLRRLGIRTLGAFAALPSSDVLARFGSDGLGAHRLASGLDERPPDARHPPVDWSVSAEVDPPADRVDRVAFLARTLADELHRRLGRDGVTCVRIGIEAETEYGEALVRFWRHEGALSDAAVADRVRWQLDGWLNGSAATRPSGGITRLALVPDELIAAKGRQLGFWGGETEVDQRAARVAARLQGQLGADAVLVPERGGGRHPAEQLRLVPAATVELAGRSLALESDAAPWPGSLPAPSPTRVLSEPIPIDVLDADGAAVVVTGRGLLSASPVVLAGRGRRLEVERWAGPWPIDERWWDPDAHARQARLQVVTVDGRAHLIALSNGSWSITAQWD